MVIGHGAGVLAVQRTQFVEQGRLVLARVARETDLALTPGIAVLVYRAIAAVLAPARAQLFLAPVAVAGL